MKTKIITLLFILVSSNLIAQQTPINFTPANDGSVISTCDGFIIDSGGQGGSGYGNNENVTITICPDTITSGNNNDMISIVFNLFNLDTYDDNPAPNVTNVDVINIWDGVGTGGNFLGNYSGNSLQGFVIQGQDVTGCITIQFVSNSQNNAGNWQFSASATCATPCSPPQAGGVIVGGPTTDSIAICVGDIVTFQEQGSFAQPGFNITSYEWDFFDGSTAPGSAGGTVQHQFNAPGHYTVNLTVTDDNSFFTCTNTNLTQLSVFVANPPTFYEFPSDTTLCIGESVDLIAQPQLYDSTWNGFPFSSTSNTGCLMDQLGVAQAQPIDVLGYPAGSTITSGADIQSICIDMEHSYMGDLVIQVQCPEGNTVTLHQQGGGGTQIGEPNPADNVSCDPNGVNPPQNVGIPYTYCFTPTATETWVEWVNNNGWGQTIPAGDYEPVQSLDGLAGCSVNGQWNIIVIDNWAADDGYVAGWSINFTTVNPNVVVFTPHVGDNADSSSWDNSGNFITNISLDGNIATVTPTSPGSYQYNYSVIDDFGCTNDSSLTITVDPQIFQNAGLDTSVCNGQLVQIGPQVAQCTNDGNNYTYCYGNNENTTFTYCPDNPGDGLTFMQIDFNQGTIESGWDELYIYDGNSTSAPQIGGLIDGDLTGLSFIATNATGCLTMSFTSDGSVSCASGFQTSWDYDVSCGGNQSLVYQWSPNDGSLDDVNIPNPTVVNPTTTTTYTLSVYPTGHPQCVTTDDVVVSIGGGLDAGTDSTKLFCFEGAPEDLFSYLGGNPQPNGQWYNPAGQAISMPIQPDTILPGLYEYRRDSAGCTASAFIDVSITQIDVSAIIDHSDCNAFNGEVQLVPSNTLGPVQYSNDNGVTFQNSDTFIGGMGSGNTYSFMIQDSIGCVATLDTVVIDDNFPVIDVASIVTVDSDCGADNGQVTAVTTNGGSPNYTYSVDGVTVGFNALPLTNLPPNNPNTYDLIVEDNFGCRDTAQITINEINQPTISVQSTNVTCYTVNDGTIDVSGNNLMSYSIDNGVTFQNTGMFTNLAPGTYDIVVATGLNGTLCTLTDQITITEPTPLQIDTLSADVTVCPGDEVTLGVLGSGGNGNYTYDWNYLGNNLGQGTTITVVADFAMQVCVTMSEDCPSPTVTQCMNVTTAPDIYPSLVASSVEGCYPVEVDFTNTTNNPMVQTTDWVFSDNGTTITAQGNDPVNYVFENPGTYNIDMIITSVDGCVYDTTYSQFITVYDHPEANFVNTPNPLTIYETETHFLDYSEGNPVQWQWNFGSGAIPLTSTEQNPTVTYPQGIAAIYPVSLYITNEFGCTDSLISQVQVLNDVLIYAPNVFTPDNDKFNQTWRVYISGIDIYDFHLILFNRWGEIIWESYNPEAVWKGTYGTDDVQDGTYVWVLHAKDSYNDKKYEFRGTVSVLR